MLVSPTSVTEEGIDTYEYTHTLESFIQGKEKFEISIALRFHWRIK